jgi:dipeptidyl aminopeptidase/acylaminoacyl peptidase
MTDFNTPLIPIEDFFRKPEKTSFSISPDGKYLAWLAPWQSRLNIHVQTIGQEEVIRVTQVEDRDIAGFFWKGEDTLIFIRDQGGDENFHLFKADRTGKEVQELTPFPGVRVEVIDELEEIDNQMLIATNKRDAQVFDVYRLYIDSGKLELIAENPGNIIYWLTDHQGKLRVAGSSDGLKSILLYRQNEQEEFQPILETDFRSEFSPRAFTFDNKNLLALSNLGRDKKALVEFDPLAIQEVKVLDQQEQADISGVLLSKHRKLVEGSIFITDKVRFNFFDQQRQEIQEFLQSQFPGYEVFITDSSKDENRLLVKISSDRSSGSQYLYDREMGQLSKLADFTPWLNSEDMAQMMPIQYQSRDGRTIYGYLTLPVGLEPKLLPIVINPHGGPWARDFWGYNPGVQFLANRGYGVLQMNFRGSLTYGRDFWEAGFKQWGRGTMQHDITDGVQWLIQEGIADPNRIAIYGGSYGGYATLAGLTFTPDLYAAGISYVGPSNLFTLFSSIPPYWEPIRQVMYEQIGNPDTEKDFVESISPFFYADQIKVPLLVVQGANDPRVKKAESDQIVQALRQRNIAVPYMVKDNEGHGFRNQENQFDFYRVMEAFLAQYLLGRSSTDIAILKPLEEAS